MSDEHSQDQSAPPSQVDYKSAEMWRCAFQSIPDSSFLFTGDRELVFAKADNPALQPWADGRIGKTCCEMFWQTEGPGRCVVDRALNNGIRAEFELIAGAPTATPFVITVIPLIAGAQSQPSGVLVTARNISDLRRAEADAIAHKSFMSSIADRSPDEIYGLNKEGRITWVNRRAETDNPLVLQGLRMIDFIAVESRGAVVEGIKRALAGEEFQSEIRAVRADESSRDVEAHTSPLWKNGEVDGVLVFLRDITDRKRTQEMVSQSDKLRAVGELAAGVAHNLNNSLTVIKGRSQLMELCTTDETILKSLRVINDAVEDGSKTLRRILEFARRDSVQEFAPVELDDLITSSVEIARPKWQQKSAEAKIEVRRECNGPVYVRGEIAELREVVLNLIFNAVDAMPAGGVLEVGTRAEIDCGCFWVADSGCGMPPETVARIFEPFFTTKGERGTGLGLSASHGIISRHGGEIIAVSEPGEGTRFEVRLPITDLATRWIKDSVEEAAESFPLI
jgi:PAS domain S-box-containing protein